MSEETPVDLTSKTSVFKRLVALCAKDFAKMKSVTPWLTSVLSVWFVIYPFYLQPKATEDAQATINDLSGQVLQLQSAVKQEGDKVRTAELTAKQNKDAYAVASQDGDRLREENSKLLLKIQELEQPGAPANAQPAPEQKASAEPPVVNTKVRRAPVVKKTDPSTWQEFVSWYEKNIGKPEGN